MREKAIRGDRNPIRRHVAWLLIFIMMFTYVNPADFAYSAEEKNWEVEYWLETDEGIPLVTEDDSIQLTIGEGEGIAIGMMLAEGKRKTARRFGESFHIYMPEKLYDLITENGEKPIDGLLESELAKEGYLLEVTEAYAKEATRSNASESSATGSNATGSNATGSNGTGSNGTGEEIYKLTFRFAEDLRKADHPKTLAVEDAEGKIFLTAAENMLFTLTQEGNDCWITMESLADGKLPRQESGMDISLELLQDYVAADTGEVIWEPDNYASSTHLTTKLNYSESASKGYEAGEITITVYGTLLDSLSEYWRDNPASNNPEYKITTNDMWEYSYDADIQAFVFTNKSAIEAGSTFSGYFEITWGATGRLMAGEYEFYAELEVNETTQATEPCTFNVEKNKRTDGIYTKKAYNAQHSDVVAMYSKLPENQAEYYWVGYDLYRSISQSLQNTMMMEYKLTDEFPEGCVVLNSAGTVITLNENNEYVFTSGKVGTSQSDILRIYVGYPKSVFDKEEANKTIKNTFDIAARYEDEETWVSYSASCGVTLVEFDFDYDGESYGMEKDGTYPSRRLPVFKIEGYTTNNYQIYPTAGNPNNVPKDIVIGDDILYISREDGSTTRLQEDEYRFEAVQFPSFSAKTGETYAGYSYTLEVMEKGEDDYKIYRTGKLPTSITSITFGSLRYVVAWRLTLHGIDGPIDSGTLHTSVDVFASDAAVGHMHNFCYLQVRDQNGKILNEPDLDSYATIDTQGEIASFDQQEYGSYMQRDVHTMAITPASTLEVGVRKSEQSAPVYDAESNVYNVTYRLDSITGNMEYMLFEDTYMTSITMYDILPDGVFTDPQKITMDYLSGYSNGTVAANVITSALLKSGAKLNSRAEINDYLEKRTIIKIEEDYKGTGRTKVTATLDFSDDPFNAEDLQRQLYLTTTIYSYILFMRVNVPAIIPNSVVQENNGKISNYVFVEADLELPDGDTFRYTNSQIDNGSYGGADTSDINENGSTTDKLGANVVTSNILFAGAAHYEMKKLVRTASTLGQFVDTADAAASTELDKVYTYLLRVCSPGSRMGNLIVYDTIEGVNSTSGWQGNLQGFDLSDAEACGIVPKVYYSVLETPGSLSAESITSGVWKVYSGDHDLPGVVTIAFDLRYDENGKLLVMPLDTVLDLKLSMKAPAAYDPKLENTKNSFSVEWELFNAEGIGGGGTESWESNEVEVELKDVIIPAATLKLIKTDEDKNPIVSDTARFELFYDVAGVHPVTESGSSSPLVLDTSLTDGSATSSFTLDPEWKRYDGTYRVFIKETKVPDGYYYPGGSLDNPYMNYMVELTFVQDSDSGEYVVSDTSKNESIYTITVEDDNQVTLTILDKKVKVSEILEITKTYTNGTLKGNDFTFKLKLKKSPAGSTVLAGDTEMTADAGGTSGRELTVTNNARGEAAFPALVFDTIGTYEFDLWEVKDESKGYIGYDSAVRTITIEVSKDSGGILYVTEVKNEEKDFTFTNTYTPYPMDKSLELTKILLHMDESKYEGAIPEFTFVMDTVGSYGGNVTMPAKLTAVSTGSGSIKFDAITFKKAGTYVFSIKEQNSTVPGITFDTTEIYATVTVEDDGAGTLSVKDNKIIYTDSTDSTLNVESFKNILDPVTTRPGKGRFTAVKSYLNWDNSVHSMAADEFQFLVTLLEQADGSTVKQGTTELTPNQEFALGTNQADGKVVFQDLTFDKAGTYVFAITEASDAAKSYIGYSQSVYYAKVVVAIPDNGKVLEAGVTYYRDADLKEALKAEEVVFTNVYKPLGTTYVLTADKQLFNADGTQVMSGIPAYTFALELDETSDPEAAVVMPATTTAQNNGAGEIRFPAITFTVKGTYRFTVKEIAAAATGTVYDNAVITFEIPVTDAAGQLTVDAANITYSKSAKTGEEDDHTFVNKIAPVSVDLEVTKTLTGRVLTDQEFTFLSEMIYASGGMSFAGRSATNSSTGEVRFPSYSFTETGTYIFKISEVQGSDSSVNYTNAICYAKVTVTKNQNAELVAEWYYGTGYNTAAYEVNGQLKEGEVPVFENTIRGYLTIKKVSWSASTPLSGAQFELSYRKAGSSDGWMVYGGTLETAGTDGSISLELPDEYWKYEYQLIETKAPAGYSKTRVGVILFTMGEDGAIASWSSSGTQGYVEISEDRTAIIAKNHTTGGGGSDGGSGGSSGGSGSDGGTATTQPGTETPAEPAAEGTAPTSEDDGLVVIAGAETPSGLAKTGDQSFSYAWLVMIMLGAIIGLTALVLKRRREE